MLKPFQKPHPPIVVHRDLPGSEGIAAAPRAAGRRSRPTSCIRGDQDALAEVRRGLRARRSAGSSTGLGVAKSIFVAMTTPRCAA